MASAVITAPAAQGGTVSITIPITEVSFIPPTPPPLIPSDAIWTSPLETQPSLWKTVHDEGTSGTSTGTGPTYPSPCGAQFAFSYTNAGGQRWWVTAPADLNANHFVYDTWVWFDNPAQCAQLELDVNHVLGNGNTVILGIQWSPSNGCWMYTTMPNQKATWNKSNIPAAVSDFAPKTWYHIQLVSHHDAAGNATYDAVIINGVVQLFQNASGGSWAALGWNPKGLINMNMQLDGVGASGSFNVFHSNLRLGRWTV